MMGILGLVAIAMFLLAFAAQTLLSKAWGPFERSLFSPDPESARTFSPHGTETDQSDGEPAYIAALRN